MLLLTLSLLACAHAGFVPFIPSKTGERIVGGDLASIADAPWQVALLFMKQGSTNDFVCGGSIIRRDVILTAASCTDGTTSNQWQIRAGSSFYANGGQVAEVSKITQNPQFNVRLDYDIALMHLSTNLVLGSFVATIALPSQDQPIFDNQKVLVTGWGLVNPGGQVSEQLRKVIVPTVNQVLCSNAYSNFNPITPRMICAGNLGSGGQDACEKDTGGPMVLNRVLIGISSWGRSCAEAEYPGVYTRVASLRSWIDTQI